MYSLEETDRQKYMYNVDVGKIIGNEESVEKRITCISTCIHTY